MAEQCERTEVGSWDNYLDNFLKADDVEDNSQLWDVFDAEEVSYNDDKKIRLHLQREKDVFIFDLNKTNTIFLKNEGLRKPSDIVGTKLAFRKVMVHNPSTGKEVESLRISKIVGIAREEKVGQ